MQMYICNIRVVDTTGLMRGVADDIHTTMYASYRKRSNILVTLTRQRYSITERNVMTIIKVILSLSFSRARARNPDYTKR